MIKTCVKVHQDVQFDPKKWDEYYAQVSKQAGKALRNKHNIGYTHYESGRRGDKIWWRVVFQGSAGGLDIEDKYLILHKKLKKRQEQEKKRKEKEKKEATDHVAIGIGDEYEEDPFKQELSVLIKRKLVQLQSSPPPFDRSPASSEDEIFNRERIESAMKNITQHESRRTSWVTKIWSEVMPTEPGEKELDVTEFLWELGHFQGFCDADGDGNITKEELEKANVGKKAIKNLFKNAEKDKSSLDLFEIGDHAIQWVNEEMSDTSRVYHAAAGYLDVFRRTFHQGARLPGWFDCEPQKMSHLETHLKLINITGFLHWARSVAFVVSIVVNLTFITISFTQIPDRDSSKAFNLTERVIRVVEFFGVWFLFLWAVADFVRYKYQMNPLIDWYHNNEIKKETLFARGFEKIFLVSKFSVMRMVIFANPPRLFENETEFIKNCLTALYFRYALSDRSWALLTCFSKSPQSSDVMDIDFDWSTTTFWSTFLFCSKLAAAIVGISGMLLKVLAFKDLDDSEMWNWDFSHFVSFFGFVVQVAGLSNLDHFPYIPPQVSCYRLKWAAEEKLYEALAWNENASRFCSYKNDSTAEENNARFEWSHIFWRLLFVGGVSRKTMMEVFYRRDLTIGIKDRLTRKALASSTELAEQICRRSSTNITDATDTVEEENERIPTAI